MRVRLAAVGALVCALVFMVGPAMGTHAPDLFISEYIEGSSNNKALEIYNGTSSAVDLAAGSYNVQMHFNGNPAAGLTINLVGTVAPGDVFVLAQSSADPVILAQADQTNGAGWFNGDDAVALRKGSTVLDVIGQIGFDPGTEWGSGLTSTADNTLRRDPSIVVGDTNGSDPFDPAGEWQGFAQNTFDGLGSHSETGVVNLSVNDVSAQEGNSGTTAFDFTVSLSSPAGPGGVSFDVATADGTATSSSGDYQAHSLTGQTIPAGSSSYSFTVQVNGDTAPEPDETFFANVTNVSGATVLDPQGLGTIVNDDVCGLAYTPIYEIQGSGPATPIPGNVSTEGIVVGDFESGASFRGFYMQDPTGDGDAATSDGIFVFTGGADRVSEGQLVRVTGTAGEFSGQTQISSVSSVVACGAGGVAPTDVSMPFAALDGPERYEGMLVRFPQPLVIAEYFNYERFGEMVLALPLEGESRPFTPTLLEEPGPPAQDRLLQNQLRRITLDDGLNTQNPPFVRHPNGDFFSLANRFRGGDTVQNMVGVLGFGFSLYRIQPTQPAQYTALNERPAAPGEVGGRITVAGFNTLNYFLTLDYLAGDPRDNACGPLQSVECRGADADQPDELQRQRVKLLESLAGLDADVVGLNELENTPDVDPAGDLVVGLNAMLGAGTYSTIDTGVIGPDTIRVGLIYKPSEVTPVGDWRILTSAVDPRFDETLSRPALAQTFEENATGARFTVVVNHLKSKGSACPGDPDLGDGQGNCNLTRKAAAEALVDWLATDPTGSGDPDFLITGDLNSYAMEDPIDSIKAGPDDTPGTADDYTNLISHFLGPFAYSFVFDGMAGYLDHSLSNASLTSQVTGVTEWHINADEPDILDYDTTFKPPEQDALFEENAFRSSDHDPVLVGLDLDTTFAGLCLATRNAVSHEGIANSLCAKLRAAEAADARGNANAKAGALGAYMNELRAQSGKALTADQAELLIELSSTL
ncbi:MAG: ExeM/NucH family extracellular endonuclease [Gaiellaceae bacterium]